MNIEVTYDVLGVVPLFIKKGKLSSSMQLQMVEMTYISKHTHDFYKKSFYKDVWVNPDQKFGQEME